MEKGKEKKRKKEKEEEERKRKNRKKKKKTKEKRRVETLSASICEHFFSSLFCFFTNLHTLNYI